MNRNLVQELANLKRNDATSRPKPTSASLADLVGVADTLGLLPSAESSHAPALRGDDGDGEKRQRRSTVALVEV